LNSVNPSAHKSSVAINEPILHAPGAHIEPRTAKLNGRRLITGQDVRDPAAQTLQLTKEQWWPQRSWK
jgi:hypothetical protein